MPITTPHIVRQLHLHVEANGTESDGLALQRRLPGLCRDSLTPAVELALDRCALPDEHLCIERLDINAGTMTLDSLDHNLAESVARVLERSLQEQIPSGDTLPMTVPGNITHQKEQYAIQDAFIYFLTTGTLPWSFRLPTGSTLESAVRDSWQDMERSSAELEALNKPFLRAIEFAATRRRLIQQFSPDFLNFILSLVSLDGKKAVDGIIEKLSTSDTLSIDTIHFDRHLWETVYACVASGKTLTSEDIVSEAWRTLSVTSEQHTMLESLLERHWPGSTSKVLVLRKGITEPIQPKRSETVPPDKTDPISPITSGTETAPTDIIEHPDAGEGIYIENAGVVILHPFLPRFFEALNIAAGDILLQPQRALCLLHFLTTGLPLAPEYELVLPKILCNVPLLTPVASDVKLTVAEKEEASALLQAVIRHWEILRNTSQDGLRGTFLIRPGKLSQRDGGDWQLQVESNTFDILLDQLPWGISMIKLPWMEKMLWVEWR